MHKFVLIPNAILLILLAGCSTARINPISSDFSPARIMRNAPQTQLWGFYDLEIGFENCEVTVLENRQAEFTCNVVNFMNSNSTSMKFEINNIEATPQYVDVDLDVGMTHPFPGMPQYRGYDVRGIFMGDGSQNLDYNSKLIHAVEGTDQAMLPDPADGYGGPDGYTRWFNYPEFSTGGLPLFQYTQGKLAPNGYYETATLNPYKYFADGLGETEDLWEYFVENSDIHGRFSSGATNTRNYYVRFPAAKEGEFSYAIIASWNGPEEVNHPANAREAVAAGVTDESTVYYGSPTNYGGDLIFDIRIWDWDSQAVSGVMSDYNLIIESSVLNSPSVFSDMVPDGSGQYWYSFQVDVPVDVVSSKDDQDFWIILEDQNSNYQNDFGVTNLCGDDRLAAFFHFDLSIDDAPQQIECGPWDPAVDLPQDQSGDKTDLSGDYQLPVWAERSYMPGQMLWHSHPFNDTEPGPIAFPVASVAADPPKLFVVWNGNGNPTQIAALDPTQNDYGSGQIIISPDLGHYIRKGLVCYAEDADTDRILYFDGSSGYQLRYIDYSNGAFIVQEPNTWPPGGDPVPLPSDGDKQECYRLVVDDQKQPIVFTQGIQFGTDDTDHCRFEFWSNETGSWGGFQIPGEIKDKYFIPPSGTPGNGSTAEWMNCFWNFAFEPTEGNLLLALSAGGSTANIVAMDRDGNVQWYHDNLFGTTYNARAAVFVAQGPGHECRILYIHTANAFLEGYHLFFARFDPFGNQLTESPVDLGVSGGLHCAPVGCLIPGYAPTNTPWRYWGQAGIGGSGGQSSRDYAYADLPSDF